MTKIAISALGTSPYTEVTYRFPDGQAIKSSYPVHAFIQRSGVRMDRTVILLTEKAREKNWELMALFLNDHKEAAGKICGVSIKDGANEQEIWEIFDVIAGEVPENAELYIDVTHGLRHLPMLLLMAASYLRAARNVVIKSISYAAFDLGKRDSKGTVLECDVFELLPFVELFDWASATRMFQETGDASRLALLLRNKSTSLNSDAGEQIRSVAQQLDDVSLALEVARPEEAMQRARDITSALDASAAQIQAYAKPFALLRGLISKAFERIKPRDDSSGDRLRRQRNLIDWYFERGRIALAVILTREWIVSSQMRREGIQDIDNQKERDRIAENLNKEPAKGAPEAEHRRHNLWIKLRDIRNQIAHAAQATQSQQEAHNIKKQFKEVLDQLNSTFTNRF